MGFFDRKKGRTQRSGSAVDAALLSELSRYGHGHFAVLAPSVPVAPEVEFDVNRRFLQFGRPFVCELISAASASPSWLAVGAERALLSATTLDPADPAAAPLLDAAVRHLRARVIPPGMVTGYEWEHWLIIRADLEAQGEPAAWAVRAGEPERGTVQLIPPARDETRHIVTMDHGPHSNTLLVLRDGDEYALLIEAPWSVDDPTRSRREDARSSDLWDIYLAASRALQTPPAWTADDFAPFDGMPRPNLSPD